MISTSLTAAIKQAALDAGFDAVGISTIPARPASLDNERSSSADTLINRLNEWLRRGYQATMAWMGRDPERRADPTLVLPGCRSVISVGMNYYTEHRADERVRRRRVQVRAHLVKHPRSSRDVRHFAGDSIDPLSYRANERVRLARVLGQSSQHDDLVEHAVGARGPHEPWPELLHAERGASEIPRNDGADAHAGLASNRE